MASQYMLKSGVVMPPVLISLFSTALGMLNIYFLILMNFRVVLNVKTTLGSLVILRTLIFLIHGHGSFIHHVCMCVVHYLTLVPVLFIVERFTASIQFIPMYFFSSVATVN